MRNPNFDWDDDKNKSNVRKHGISFEEAQTVFDDEDAVYDDDDEHSFDEQRFIILGKSATPNLLMVCHCYKEDNDKIRIISARKASKSEMNQYVINGGTL
jgi:hypothetical protein